MIRLDPAAAASIWVSMETYLMQSRNSLAYSQRRSRALLAAWNSADLERLETTLYSAPAIPAAATSEEEERREMVAGVECGLRTWIEESAGRNQVALLASLKLLRHLAGCEALGNIPELSVYALQGETSFSLSN